MTRSGLSSASWNRTRGRIAVPSDPSRRPMPPPPPHMRDIEMATPAHLMLNPHIEMIDRAVSPSKFYQRHKNEAPKTDFYSTVKSDGQTR